MKDDIAQVAVAASIDAIADAPITKDTPMTIASRIDDVHVAANGVINLSYTTGYPVPDAASGIASEFQSKADLINAIAGAEETLASIMHLIAASRFVKADPVLANPTAMKGHGTTMDLSGVAQVIQNF